MGKEQQAARSRLIEVLSGVISSFEKSHAIVIIKLSKLASAQTPKEYKKRLS